MDGLDNQVTHHERHGGVEVAHGAGHKHGLRGEPVLIEQMDPYGYVEPPYRIRHARHMVPMGVGEYAADEFGAALFQQVHPRPQVPLGVHHHRLPVGLDEVDEVAVVADFELVDGHGAANLASEAPMVKDFRLREPELKSASSV